ncbi:MAG: MoxR family ATPase [Firmicutes bacterium]|nr:MoxR family ATPase [Bacillota bacterium]
MEGGRSAWQRLEQEWVEKLAEAGYVAEGPLALTAGLALALERPLLLEGPAGSGKTYLAEALAVATGRPLVRLQCYEGIDAQSALYDWNYHAQLVALQRSHDINPFDFRFLLPRPLMQALLDPAGAVLLVDEVDRADEGFEALLLEYLADYRISVPEWGRVEPAVKPITVLTSNRTRPLSDALRRRCLYAYVDWPEAEREATIIRQWVPEMPEGLTRALVRAVGCLRSWPLVKPPGLAESLDWARASRALAFPPWSEAFVRATLGMVVKDHLDLQWVVDRIGELVAGPA